MTLSAVFNQVTMPNERDRQIAAHAFALGANAVLARIYADTNWLKLLREIEVELAEIGEQPAVDVKEKS